MVMDLFNVVKNLYYFYCLLGGWLVFFEFYYVLNVIVKFDIIEYDKFMVSVQLNLYILFLDLVMWWEI